MILDDVDSRPGSATSLLRTVIGSYIRDVGGWFSVAEIVRLMDAIDITSAHARTAILRIKNKGVLVPEMCEGHQGYRIPPAAVTMLERGDRRIFTFRQQENGGAWCLVSFSLPESERAARHQLRKRLAWIGCGTVSTGLWICPAFLAGEVEEILTELGVRHWATVFITETPQPDGSLRDAVRTWWDLDSIAGMHHKFIDGFAQWGPAQQPREAFAHYVRMLDGWRQIPYLDPGLQPAVLPANWPGFASVALFERLRSELEPAAERFVHGERLPGAALHSA